MKNRVCGVYAIVNTTNGKGYVGSSWNVYGRWRHHRKTLRGGTGSQYLQRAWSKHGEAAFAFVLLDECAPAVVRELEATWIGLLGACRRSEGYNLSPTTTYVTMTPDGRARSNAAVSACWTGRKHRPESLALMSQQRRGKGCGPRDPAIGQKISASLTGHPHSAERRAATSRPHGVSPKLRAHLDRLHALTRERAQTQEGRARLGKISRDAWTPERKAVMGARVRAWWAFHRGTTP